MSSCSFYLLLSKISVTGGWDFILFYSSWPSRSSPLSSKEKILYSYKCGEKILVHSPRVRLTKSVSSVKFVHLYSTSDPFSNFKNHMKPHETTSISNLLYHVRLILQFGEHWYLQGFIPFHLKSYKLDSPLILFYYSVLRLQIRKNKVKNMENLPSLGAEFKLIYI